MPWPVAGVGVDLRWLRDDRAGVLHVSRRRRILCAAGVAAADLRWARQPHRTANKSVKVLQATLYLWGNHGCSVLWYANLHLGLLTRPYCAWLVLKANHVPGCVSRCAFESPAVLTFSRLIDSACRALRAIANTRVAHVVLRVQALTLKLSSWSANLLVCSEFCPALPPQRGLCLFPVRLGLAEHRPSLHTYSSICGTLFVCVLELSLNS